MRKLPLLKDLRRLLIALKPDIGDEYRASGDQDSTTPSMDVTIGVDETGAWGWQTGDNSYAGAAYSYPHWAIVTLTRRSNSTALARDIRDQLDDLMSL